MSDEEGDATWLARESAGTLDDVGALEDDFDNAETFGDLEEIGWNFFLFFFFSFFFFFFFFFFFLFIKEIKLLGIAPILRKNPEDFNLFNFLEIGIGILFVHLNSSFVFLSFHSFLSSSTSQRY